MATGSFELEQDRKILIELMAPGAPDESVTGPLNNLTTASQGVAIHKRHEMVGY